ncbi:hypothetical protein DUNSADRAFT_16326 [Dunaliella salina]|uniref:Uncharacterized protein n=1 Tax=Dunaliella salina TaxID=3046 RepID=A0ABQ7G3V1_DUNSA|nr:hypothetical protein DUNSADRAFT_16326 [Dunaliella salina]|eukprot:KAF5829266.1 hypothetical protein DUNSADRAFT_16326 [Dunaliella salina]
MQMTATFLVSVGRQVAGWNILLGLVFPPCLFWTLAWAIDCLQQALRRLLAFSSFQTTAQFILIAARSIFLPAYFLPPLYIGACRASEQ